MGGRDQQGPARHPPEVPVAADDPSLLKEDGWRRTGEKEGEGRGGEGRGKSETFYQPFGDRTS